MTSIVDLAQEILDEAKKLESYAASKGLGLASLERDVFASMPAEQEQLQIAINDKAQALRQLVTGPVAFCSEILLSVRFTLPILGCADNLLSLATSQPSVWYIPIKWYTTFLWKDLQHIAKSPIVVVSPRTLYGDSFALP